jgi:very-short-patch-repair endonuclease
VANEAHRGWDKRRPALLAAEQHGVIKASQLGVSSTTIMRWEQEGRLYRKYRGVYAYGHAALSREGEWMAGVLAGGKGAALGGLCAAALLRTTNRIPVDIHVIVPRSRRPQAGLRLQTCRRLDPRDVTVVNRIPVTTVARTLIDLSDDEEPEDLARLMHEAAYRGILSVTALRAAMKRANGRWHLDRIERAIELHLSGSAGTRSRLEKRFRRLIREAKLPQPRHNVVIRGFEVDFVWPGLVVEIDGPGHERPSVKHADAIQDAALAALGYRTVRVTEAAFDAGLEAIVRHIAGRERKLLA